MDNNKLIWGIGLFFSIFIIFLFIYTLSPFFNILCWAAILSFYLYPVYKFLNKKIKDKKLISAILTIFGFICFIIFPLTFVTFTFYYQVSAILTYLAPLLKKDFSSILQEFQNYPFLYNIFNKIYLFFEPVWGKIETKITDALSELIRYGINLITNLFRRSAIFSFQLVFTILALFYFLIDGERFICIIKNLFPGEEREKTYILQKISDILRGILYGSILTSIVQGALALIIYAALEVPQYIIWTILTVITSFIPVLGTFLIWGPIVVFLLIKGSYIKALILFLYSALIVSQVDNVLKPILIGEKAQLHNLLVFFSVLGGLTQFGILGLFLGPVILGLFLCVIEIYKIKVLKQNLPNA